MATLPRGNVIVPQKLSSHVHPHHPVMHHSDHRDYTCHGCKTSGSGDRFRCHACTVHIHVYCSDCPQQLPSSFLHAHGLALVPRMNNRRCNVCRESIDGMFYRCDHCDFDAHPLCTQLPEQLRHVIDGLHKLRLRKLPSSSGHCSVCEIDCSSLWVYGCDVCRVNIHPKCLLKPYGERRSEKSPDVAPSGSRKVPPWTTVQRPHYSPWEFPNYNYHNSYPPPPSPWPNHGGYTPRLPSWPWTTVQRPHYSPSGFPNYNYHNNSYPPPSPWANYGGYTPQLPSPPTWFPMIGVGSSLAENLLAGSIVEFVFGSLGF